MSQYDLKPCPYCGTVPSTDTRHNDSLPKVMSLVSTQTYEIVDKVQVICDNCHMSGPKKDTKEEAAKAWNELALLKQTVVEVHSQRADDLCWMDLVKIFAAAGLPTPDCRVGDKFAMLNNCERFVGTLESGGPWKSYAELMDWIAWLNSQCGAANILPDHHTDKGKLTEIACYVREWFNTKTEKPK